MSSRSSPKNAVVRLRDELTGAILDAIWAQWRAIGGSASNAKTASAIVDPEALILASLVSEQYEPRVRDILYAWVERNAPLLSVGRLRKIAPPDPSVADRLRTFAATAAKLAKQPRWTTLTADHAEPDARLEHFLAARAMKPALEAPPALMLRMRAALGVGAKADSLTYLLGQADRPHPDPTTVRAIAKALGYTLVATRSALEDLAAAKFVIASSERPVSFAAPQRGWHDLLGIARLPAWRPWPAVYGFAHQFLSWAKGVGERNVSDAVLRIHQQEMLEMNPAVRDLTSFYAVSHTGSYAGPVETLTSWLRTPGTL
jgi:hypothetical protein